MRMVVVFLWNKMLAAWKMSLRKSVPDVHRYLQVTRTTANINLIITATVFTLVSQLSVTTADIQDSSASNPIPGPSPNTQGSLDRDLYPPTDVRPCSQSDSKLDQDQQMPLPELDDQFEARIEAKILQKGYTVDVAEYYDYPNNRGVVRRTKGGVTSTWLYDFKDYVSFLVVGSSCWLSDLRQEGFQFFNFTFGDRGGHIEGVTQLFHFGLQYNETYVGGNETVRGIPVDHWTSCIEWDRYGAVFQLDYYFSKADYSMPVGKKQIPIQAVLRGHSRNGDKDAHTFHHIYDFVFYKPGPFNDPSVFEVPRGTVCTHRDIQRQRPDLPDSFQMEVEMVQPQDHVVSLRKYYYDFNLKLSRYDLQPNDRSMTDWAEKYGFRPIILIHDYNKGIQYVLDKVSRNCSMSKLTLNTVDADPRIHDPSHVIMRHGRDLFDLDQLNFSYQGKRRYREISCQVWAALRVNWPQQGTNTTVEIYFNKDNWTIEAQRSGAKQPDIVGLWLTLVDSTDNYVSEWVNHIFSYSAKDPDLGLFDVLDCYSQKDTLDVRLTLKASYTELVRRGLMYTEQALHLQIAKVTQLHPIRLSDIKFRDIGDTKTEVIITFLEEAILEGESLNQQNAITARQALQTLENHTKSDSGFSIVVEYPDGSMKYEVVRGSVASRQTDGSDIGTDCQQTSSHVYTSGSMAGLGISMLLLGIVIGAAGVYLHRSNKPLIDIPYRAQD